MIRNNGTANAVPLLLLFGRRPPNGRLVRPFDGGLSPSFRSGDSGVRGKRLREARESASWGDAGTLVPTKVVRLILEEMGHKQPPIPIHVDNTTAIGIVNSTIKRQRSRAMEMRYFWLLDQEVQKRFKIAQHPGQENLGDYPSKAHTGQIHQHVRPYYIWQDNSPTLLQRALQPSARRGCAEILADRYLKRIPLPRIPTFPAPSSTARSSVGQMGSTKRSSVWPRPAAL